MQQGLLKIHRGDPTVLVYVRSQSTIDWCLSGDMELLDVVMLDEGQRV